MTHPSAAGSPRRHTFALPIARSTYSPAAALPVSIGDSLDGAYRRKTGLDRPFAERRAAAMARPRPTNVVRIPE